VSDKSKGEGTIIDANLLIKMDESAICSAISGLILLNCRVLLFFLGSL